MKNLIKKVIQSNPSDIADFFRLHKELHEDLVCQKVESEKKIKIAFLASFTANGFAETLFVKCCELGVLPEIYVGDYNQYHQEILNPNSELYKFDPDLLFVFIDSRTLLGDYFFIPYSLSSNDRLRWVKDKLTEIKVLVDTIKSKSTAKIILHNFEVPHYSPLGILENKQDFGLVESIEMINFELRNGYKKDSQVFIFDFNSFSSYIGKANFLEYKMYYLADLRVDFKNIPKLCEAYLSYVKPATHCIKKCIILDLDNTIWGGVVGEDGLEGIKVGPTPEGRPFWEFQKYLLSLFHRGIVLAINSKNNYEDAIKVFREHPDMILREEHFASIKMNWNDKVSNIKAIAEEINIGVDSLVYFDDDKLNREMVRSELPDVLVVEMPEDFSLYPKILSDLNDFNYFQLTEEDKEKGKMYAEQRVREEFKSASTDINKYLKGLRMEVEIEEMNDFNLPRLAQLTQKTNQFNLTTKRYTEEDLKKIKDQGDLIISVRVKDKFGDSGITGMVIVKRDKNEYWGIDSLLLSCRVIGRKVEETILGHIIKKAKEANILTLKAQFILTKKNVPAKEFYKNSGFELVDTSGEVENWEYNLQKAYFIPDYIKVITK